MIRVMEDDEIKEFLKDEEFPVAVWVRYDVHDIDSPWEFIKVNVDEAWLHNAFVFNSMNEALEELSKYYN